MLMWCLKKVKADMPTRALLEVLGPDYTYVDRYYDMEWVIVASTRRRSIKHPVPGDVVKPWRIRPEVERRSDVVIVHVVQTHERAGSAGRAGVKSIDVALDILRSIHFPLQYARRVFLNRKGQDACVAARPARAHRANLFYVQMQSHAAAAACLGQRWDAVPYPPHDAYVHVSQLCETTFTHNAAGEVSVDIVDGCVGVPCGQAPPQAPQAAALPASACDFAATLGSPQLWGAVQPRVVFLPAVLMGAQGVWAMASGAAIRAPPAAGAAVDLTAPGDAGHLGVWGAGAAQAHPRVDAVAGGDETPLDVDADDGPPMLLDWDSDNASDTDYLTTSDDNGTPGWSSESGSQDWARASLSHGRFAVSCGLDA